MVREYWPTLSYNGTAGASAAGSGFALHPASTVANTSAAWTLFMEASCVERAPPHW